MQKSKLQLKIKKFITFNFLLVFLTFNFLLLTFPHIVRAVTMYSPQYNIESANINDAAGNKSSSGYRLSDTIGQLAAGEFSSQGYVVKAGFQYLNSIIPFRFAVSPTQVDLGTLTANTPKTATTNLTVSSGGAKGYQVTVVEQGQLKTPNTLSSIPNTSCDGGVNTCNETLAKIWNSTSSYGFGYNITGQDIPADFIDSTYFRPFPDSTVPQSPAVVMSSNNVGRSKLSTVTFKVNVPPIQPAGTYQTIISFVATPSY